MHIEKIRNEIRRDQSNDPLDELLSTRFPDKSEDLINDKSEKTMKRQNLTRKKLYKNLRHSG